MLLFRQPAMIDIAGAKSMSNTKNLYMKSSVLLRMGDIENLYLNSVCVASLKWLLASSECATLLGLRRKRTPSLHTSRAFWLGLKPLSTLVSLNIVASCSSLCHLGDDCFMAVLVALDTPSPELFPFPCLHAFSSSRLRFLLPVFSAA